MILSRAIVKARRALDPTKSTMSGEVVIDREVLQTLVDVVQAPTDPRKPVARYLQCALGTANILGVPLCSKTSEVCPGFEKCKADCKPKKPWNVVAYMYGRNVYRVKKGRSCRA